VTVVVGRNVWLLAVIYRRRLKPGAEETGGPMEHSSVSGQGRRGSVR
jgi:hypothetical protein